MEHSEPESRASQAPDFTVDSQPWLRRPGESAKAHAAADIYFKLRDERSLEVVAGRLRKHKSLIARWSAKYQWPARARAYDAGQAQLEQEAVDRYAKEQAVRIAELVRDQRAEKDLARQRYLDASKTIHKIPVLEQKRVVERYEDGREKTTQIFKPAGVRKTDEIRFADAAFALGDELIGAANTNAEPKLVTEYEIDPYVGAQEK
jgi:hypothetical protein